MHTTTSILVGGVILLLVGATSALDFCPPIPPNPPTVPHPDCTKYVICDVDHETIMDCPGGLYYNEVTKLCDFPENVENCEGGTRPPGTGGTTRTTTMPSSTVETTELSTTDTQVTEEPVLPTSSTNQKSR